MSANSSSHSSDDELPDEPSPQYLQMRRRSNTLPKDFLSSLRNKATIQVTHDESFDAEDEVDAKEVLPPKILNHKLKKILKERDCQASPTIPSGIEIHVLKTDNHVSKTHLLPPIHRSCIDEKTHSPAGTPRRKISNVERPKILHSPTHEEPKNGHVSNSNTDNLLNTLMKEATDEELLCTKKQRGPLPRGSSLYENLLKEFGREEEERDFLSPLPSPNIRRKFSHGSRSGIRSAQMYNEITQSVPSTPPLKERRVHWSQDTHFNKYK